MDHHSDGRGRFEQAVGVDNGFRLLAFYCSQFICKSYVNQFIVFCKSTGYKHKQNTYIHISWLGHIHIKEFERVTSTVLHHKDARPRAVAGMLACRGGVEPRGVVIISSGGHEGGLIDHAYHRHTHARTLEVHTETIYV